MGDGCIVAVDWLNELVPGIVEAEVDACYCDVVVEVCGGEVGLDDLLNGGLGEWCYCCSFGSSGAPLVGKACDGARGAKLEGCLRTGSADWVRRIVVSDGSLND
jgi:hypothetical protein